jgi:hypothetical protein
MHPLYQPAAVCREFLATPNGSDARPNLSSSTRTKPRGVPRARYPVRMAASCILPAVKPKKTEPRRALLLKELRDAVTEIDEEGLLFLLRQAQVLVYNARVEHLNAQAEKIGKTGKPDPRAAGGRRSPVSIEEPEGGKTIFLTLGKARKVLTPEEMKRLVRICYAAETKSEALRQLFTVLARERRDILADAVIGSADNPLVEELFTVIRATYRLKNR